MEVDHVEEIKSLMLINAQAVVDRSDDVRIKVVRGEQTVVYEVSVHKDDLGKIIGKKGRMAGSLRIILLAVSVKYKIRCVLEIVE